MRLHAYTINIPTNHTTTEMPLTRLNDYPEAVTTEGEVAPERVASETKTSGSSNCNVHENTSLDLFQDLMNVRKRHPDKLLCAYLNINSMRYKFDYIRDLLQRNIVDLFFIAETKLDESFVDCQFQVNNYMLWRADRNSKGGGLAAYLRSDIAGDRKKALEFQEVESIGIELNCNGHKYFIAGMYKPPSMSDAKFLADFNNTVDKITTKYDTKYF